MEKIDALRFFDQKPYAYSLYQRFRDRVLAEIGEASIKVQKTQITFSNRRVFACVSQMRVRKKRELPEEYIVVTFGLNHSVDAARIAVKTEPYPNRWTHHVLVSSPEDIDAELMNWVREAYVFAGQQ